MSLRIAFSGDFICLNPDSLVPDPLEQVSSALASDLWWVSLDSSIEGSAPSAKAGPSLFCPVGSLEILARNGARFVSLANNHSMDGGREGLIRLMQALAGHSISAAGAGTNRASAFAPVLHTEPGTAEQIAVVCVCEPQFGVAEDAADAGVASCMAPALVETLLSLKDRRIPAIVFCHAGAEMLPLPPPELRQLARHWVDVGAAAVIFHHAHVLQGAERYRGTPIYYSLGNLLFDMQGAPDQRTQGMSVVLEFERGRLRSSRNVFHRFDGKAVRVSGEHGEDATLVADLSAALGEAYAALWQEQAIYAYERFFFPYFRDIFSRQPEGLDRVLGIQRVLHQVDRPSSLLLWQVLMRCPSIRWTLDAALGVQSGERQDLRSAASREEFLRLRKRVCATDEVLWRQPSSDPVW